MDGWVSEWTSAWLDEFVSGEPGGSGQGHGLTRRRGGRQGLSYESESESYDDAHWAASRLASPARAMCRLCRHLIS